MEFDGRERDTVNNKRQWNERSSVGGEYNHALMDDEAVNNVKTILSYFHERDGKPAIIKVKQEKLSVWEWPTDNGIYEKTDEQIDKEMAEKLHKYIKMHFDRVETQDNDLKEIRCMSYLFVIKDDIYESLKKQLEIQEKNTPPGQELKLSMPKNVLSLMPGQTPVQKMIEARRNAAPPMRLTASQYLRGPRVEDAS